MNKLFSLLLLIFITSVNAQKEESDKILEEGKLLYRLEKGSWYGTDHFLAKYKDKRDSIGGYFSYENSDNKINTVFFNRFDNNKILVRYTFDSIPTPNPINIDFVNKKASELEKDLITIRQDALNKANKNEDAFFSFYQKTALNFIPLITENERKVLVLTGPQISGVVLIGNDYKLTYKKDNTFLSKEKIHKSLLQFAYKSDNPENKTLSSIHSHIVTPMISSTDICTLLLYKDYIEWTSHTVVSQDYVSIFDLEKELLVVMTREAWDKINN